jgi:hypothetical protein
MPLFETIFDIQPFEQKIKSRPYGMIEVEDGQLLAIHLRPWPKLISAVEATWIGGWKHKRDRKNRCLLYYNQPMAHRNFLTLAYIQSTLGTSFKTFRKSLLVLDHVAMLKRSDALLCEATNERIPDRLFRRWGWEPHLEQSKKRHWIKRFYGDYDQVAEQSQTIVELSK